MSYEFFRIKEVKGRKEHQCQHCLQKIEKGEQHFECAQKFDGDFFSYREHKDCREAWTALWDIHGRDYDGFPFLHEVLSDEPEDREWLKAQFPHVASRFPDLTKDGA